MLLQPFEQEIEREIAATKASRADRASRKMQSEKKHSETQLVTSPQDSEMEVDTKQEKENMLQVVNKEKNKLKSNLDGLIEELISRVRRHVELGRQAARVIKDEALVDKILNICDQLEELIPQLRDALK